MTCILLIVFSNSFGLMSLWYSRTWFLSLVLILWVASYSTKQSMIQNIRARTRQIIKTLYKLLQTINWFQPRISSQKLSFLKK